MKRSKYKLMNLAVPIVAIAAVLSLPRAHFFHQNQSSQAPISSGRYLSPVGTTVNLGSFPCNMAPSPDGRFLAVTDSGFRESLSILNAETGEKVFSKTFDGKASNGKDDGLYFGLNWATLDGQTHLFVSRGPQEQVLDFIVSPDGSLDFSKTYTLPAKLSFGPVAGVAVSQDGSQICVAINGQTGANHHGLAYLIDRSSGDIEKTVQVPAYPLQAVSVGSAFYVGCERDGVVARIESDGTVKTIRVGLNPVGMLADSANHRIFVANASSDTISQIDTGSDQVVRTTLVRPQPMRTLPGATPLGMCLAPNDRLLVTLGDLNCVGVVDLKRNTLVGLIPTGWYPTAVNLSNDGQTLIVSNAKGTESRVPNGASVKGHGQYILNILEGNGTVANYPTCMKNLVALTKQSLANASLGEKSEPKVFVPRIQHVIYIIKENRTYDQVFGDIKRGNGDPALTMFGASITPNEHALVKRFGLYDNFYTCADVSADGWSWSVAGMASEYVVRNAPPNYSGRRDHYDFEGENGGYAPDVNGDRDVNAPAGGYLWDDALKHKRSTMNFGFYIDQAGEILDDGSQLEAATKKNLVAITDPSFREFDLAYADSDLWVKDHFSAPKQMKQYGKFHSTCRYQEWMRYFKKWNQTGQMPELQMLRIMRDHTAGTNPGEYTPQAMVADNDYCIGEIVQTISHSKFWKNTLICILEDDSQAGYDHVDCHRSTALLISPYLERSYVDSSFHNTDSMLKTIELALGLPAMNSYDANAEPMGRFWSTALNAEPYTAIEPSREIASAIVAKNAYRAKFSAKYIARLAEHTEPDLELNDVLWGYIMGVKTPRPPVIGFDGGD